MRRRQVNQFDAIECGPFGGSAPASALKQKSDYQHVMFSYWIQMDRLFDNLSSAGPQAMDATFSTDRLIMKTKDPTPDSEMVAHCVGVNILDHV